MDLGVQDRYDHLLVSVDRSGECYWIQFTTSRGQNILGLIRERI
jgi:hypothetical protein